jgi:predicted permease
MPASDFRYAFRGLRNSPVLAVATVTLLSLVIGANTAVFSLIDQLLLRTLPVENPRELVQLAQRGFYYGSSWGQNVLSYPMYKDIRDRNEVFSGVFCRFGREFSIADVSGSERVHGELVSGNYFSVLGIRSAAGRVLSPEDDGAPGTNPVTVLSHDYWASRFNYDSAVIGRTVHVNGMPLTVLGVAQRGFRGVEIGQNPALFVPVSMFHQMVPNIWDDYSLESRRGRWVNVFARLRYGITPVRARAGLEPLYQQMIHEEVREPGFSKVTDYARRQFLDSRMEVFDGATGRSELREDYSAPLSILMAITGLVLVTACASVANLLIARSTVCQKETAVRLALGARATQIVRQLLIEGCLLAVIAAAAGLMAAGALERFLLRFVAADIKDLNIRPVLDGRVLTFSLVLAFLSTLLFALAPALRATRQDVATALRAGSTSIAGAHARFRRALVIVQLGLSLVLLVGSGLFARSLQKLYEVDLGFRSARVLSFAIDPPIIGYKPEETDRFYRKLAEILKGLPGAQSVGYASVPIVAGKKWDDTVTVEGYQGRQGEDMDPNFNSISPEYFATLGVPLVAGRDINWQDARQSHKVCIVNETFAKRYFPAGTAIGHHLGIGSDPDTKLDQEIVGIARDMKYENVRETVPRQVFLPQSQLPIASGIFVYVRTSAKPSHFFMAVRKAVHHLDPGLPLHELRTLEEQVAQSLAPERAVAALSVSFGVLGTLLATISLYALVAFSVARRSKEISIRMALGAAPQRILRFVLGEVAILVAIGAAIGLPAYLLLSKLVQSELYGITSTDAWNIGTAVVLLAIVSLFAGLVPARRAAAFHPMDALNQD